MGIDVSDSETTSSAPDVRDLRAFCAVVDFRSVTAAARELRETKGSVSRRVSRLERQLGVLLVRRNPRVIEPTEDGFAYRNRLAQVLELLDDAHRTLRHGKEAPAGHLRVTAPIDFGDIVLAPIVARFCEKFPAVTVEMLLTDQRLDMEGQQIDVAFRASFGPLLDTTMTAHELDELHAQLFATRAYLREHGTPEQPSDLASHRVVVSGVSRRARTVELHRLSDPNRGASPVRFQVSASDFTFVREVTLANGGIGLMPSNIGRRDVARGRLVPLLEDYAVFTATIHLVHQGTRFVAPKVRAFRDHVIAAFASS